MSNPDSTEREAAWWPEWCLKHNLYHLQGPEGGTSFNFSDYADALMACEALNAQQAGWDARDAAVRELVAAAQQVHRNEHTGACRWEGPCECGYDALSEALKPFVEEVARGS